MNLDLDNFQRVYYEKIKPFEEQIEKDKKILTTKIVIYLVIAFVVDIFLIAIAKLNPSDYQILLIPFFIIAFYIGTAVKNSSTKIKNTIFPELFKSIDPNLSYNGKAEISFNIFKESNFFSNYSASYKPSDFLTTKIDNKDVLMIELTVESGSGKSRTTVFEGVFVNIVLDKNIKNDMKIVNNSTKDFGIFKSLFPNEDKVNLENMEFEEKYDVYCADQIYARKIITLTFMEKLLYATNKLNTRIRLSFKENNIYIAIDNIHVINDNNILSNKIDIENIAKEVDNILEVIKTIEYLDLDEKIN